MDLLSSESRKTGTRGGRARFTWDSVKDEERHFYLGNSVAKPHTSIRNASNPDFDWYARPNRPLHPPRTPTVPSSFLTTSASDLQAVRRRERAVMDTMIVGRSFSDAVRSALTESVESSVDDEGTNDPAVAAEPQAHRKREKTEKTEKAQRKEMRRRIRELRRMRRAEKSRRRDRHHQAQTPHHDSSESEREGIRSRLQEEAGRRRRRREKDSTTSRKRPDWCSTSDSEDPDQHRARRQRLR